MELIEIVAFCIFEVVGPVVALSFGMNMKELDMKQVFKHSRLGVLLITLFASVCFADENVGPKDQGIQQKYHRKVGFHGALNGDLMIFSDYNTYSGLDIYPLPIIGMGAGYQFNPYISVDLNISTLLFLVWKGEVSTKINFSNTRISPYIAAGVAATNDICFSEYGECDDFIGLYNAGAGVDFDLTRHSSLYVEVKFWGNFKSNSDVDNDDSSETMIVPIVGYRFKF